MCRISPLCVEWQAPLFRCSTFVRVRTCTYAFINSGVPSSEKGFPHSLLRDSALAQKYFAWTALHAPLGSGGGSGATFELLQSKPKPGLLKVANSTEGAETVALTLSSMDSLECSTQLTVESSSHIPPQVSFRQRCLAGAVPPEGCLLLSQRM